MSSWQAIILGVIQGFTEFLPVSSSGHLVLAQLWLGADSNPRIFIVFLHCATLLVVLIFFRKQVARLFACLGRFAIRKTVPEDKSTLRLWLIIITATFFTGLIGLFVSSLSFTDQPILVAGLFMVTGLILFLTRFFRGRRNSESLKTSDGAIIGLAQGLGVFPGISRSGITIAAALAAGIDRQKAGEISFLISAPAILGALLLDLKDTEELALVVPPSRLALGCLSAFIAGFAALALLMRFVKSGRLHIFSYYLFAIGIGSLIKLLVFP